MGKRDLQQRLERLERRIPQPYDQEEKQRWAAHFLEHFKAWSKGQKLEETPEEIRNAQMWACTEEYGPVFLQLVREGNIEGREELIAAGVDFDLAAGCSDVVGGQEEEVEAT